MKKSLNAEPKADLSILHCWAPSHTTSMTLRMDNMIYTIYKSIWNSTHTLVSTVVADLLEEVFMESIEVVPPLLPDHDPNAIMRSEIVDTICEIGKSCMKLELAKRKLEIMQQQKLGRQKRNIIWRKEKSIWRKRKSVRRNTKSIRWKRNSAKRKKVSIRRKRNSLRRKRNSSREIVTLLWWVGFHSAKYKATAQRYEKQDFDLTLTHCLIERWILKISEILIRVYYIIQYNEF